MIWNSKPLLVHAGYKYVAFTLREQRSVNDTQDYTDHVLSLNDSR
jgi:hypothetical protein